MAHASRARTAVTAVFFLNGIVFASWYSRLPSIQEELDLGPGTLGLALLGAPVGLLAAQPLTGALSATVGSRRLVAAAPLLLAAAVAPALAVSAPTLALGAFVAGAANLKPVYLGAKNQPVRDAVENAMRSVEGGQRSAAEGWSEAVKAAEKAAK